MEDEIEQKKILPTAFCLTWITIFTEIEKFF